MRVPLSDSFPEGVKIHLEDVQIDECATGSSVGELHCSFAFHPQPVFEDHVNASPQQHAGVAVKRRLEPFMEFSVGIRDTDAILPFVRRQAHAMAVGFETPRKRCLPRTGETAEKGECRKRMSHAVFSVR